MKKILPAILLTMLYSTTYAQHDVQYPDVIPSRQFTFRPFSEDSLKLLSEYMVSSLVADGAEHSRYEDIKMLVIEEGVFLVVKYNHEWCISTESFSREMFDTYSIIALNLDNEGVHEILVKESHSDGHGNMYGGYSANNNKYWLVNFDKEYRMFLKETNNIEHIIYTGYVAGGDATEEEYERQDAEMEKNENYSTDYETDHCVVRIMPGRVIFEDISCNECMPALDTIYSIEYVLKNDSLYKNSVRAKLKNQAPAYSYRRYKGNIGPRSATMHLYMYYDRFLGYYYFDDEKKQTPLFGRIHIPPATAVINANDDNSKVSFMGSLDSNEFKGRWSDTDTGYEFSLRVAQDTTAALITTCHYYDGYGDRGDSVRYSYNAYFLHLDSGKMNKEKWHALEEEWQKYMLGVTVQEHYTALETFLRQRSLAFDLLAQTGNITSGHIGTATNNMQMQSWLRYNDDGILCVETTNSGGLSFDMWHRKNYFLFDTYTGNTLSRNMVFNCHDSVLCNYIANGVSNVKYIEEQDLKKIQDYCVRGRPGIMHIIPGYFLFYYPEAHHSVSIPMKELKQYIKPEYQKRLLPE